jgi:hypothetical protein
MCVNIILDNILVDINILMISGNSLYNILILEINDRILDNILVDINTFNDFRKQFI